MGELNVCSWKIQMKFFLVSNDDIVDRYVNELDEESNESHDAEADGCGDSDLLELATVRLGASLN